MTVQRNYKKPAVHEMDFDEAYKRIQTIREQRRIFNDRTVRKKAKQRVKRAADDKAKLRKLLAALTPEQLAALRKGE